METLGKFILKYKIIICLILLGTTVFFASFLKSLVMEEDETTWFSKDNVILEDWNEFAKLFEDSSFIVIAYRSDDIFKESEISYLSYLSKRLESVSHVQDVRSLTTIKDITGANDELNVDYIPFSDALSGQENGVSGLIRRIDGNGFIKGNLISNDHKTIAVILTFDASLEKYNDTLPKQIFSEIKTILDDESQKTGKTFHFGGGIIADTELKSIMERDMQKFSSTSMLIIALIILLIFRRISYVFISMTTVVFALVWTLGLKGALHSPITQVSTTLLALIKIIGIMDSIHIISHFLIEYDAVNDKKIAMLRTFKHAGMPCFYTSLTTSIGFGSLCVSSIPAIKHFGMFASFGIMSAFLLSMTIVPIGLMLFKVKPVKRKETSISRLNDALESSGNFALKHFKVILLAYAGIIVLMLFGIPKIEIEGSLINFFKNDSRLKKDVQFIDQNLNGISSTEILLYGDKDAFVNPATLKRIEDFENTFITNTNVMNIYSPVDYIKLINRALHDDNPEFYTIPGQTDAVAQAYLLYELYGGTDVRHFVSGSYDIARISVRTQQMSANEMKQFQNEIKDYVDAHFTGFKVKITGLDFLIRNFIEQIAVTQVKSLVYAFAIILMIMILLFGFRMGFISIIPNILPIVILFGIMGYSGFKLSLATAMIAAMAIGIVVDDTIHFFAHFRNEASKSVDMNVALTAALHKVGRAMFFSSVVLFLGFIIFIMSETKPLLHYGILSSVTVVAALVGDIFVGSILLVKTGRFKTSPAR